LDALAPLGWFYTGMFKRYRVAIFIARPALEPYRYAAGVVVAWPDGRAASRRSNRFSGLVENSSTSGGRSIADLKDGSPAGQR
jgi:hypothetical protein